MEQVPSTAHSNNWWKGGVPKTPRLLGPPQSEGADTIDILSTSCTLGNISVLLLLRVLKVAPASYCVENQLYFGPSDKNSSPLSSIFKRLEKASHLFPFFQCK